MTAVETHTPSGLSDYVKDFLIQFKDKTGSFRYVEEIDIMKSQMKFLKHLQEQLKKY